VIDVDVARESADAVIEQLQSLGLHHTGAITMSDIDTTISDSAEQAERLSPGASTDAMIWEQIEAKARERRGMSASFLMFMALAAAIACVGVIIDSPILIVGAMVIGPDYEPVAALIVDASRRRFRNAFIAFRTLTVGLVAAIATSAAVTGTLRLFDDVEAEAVASRTLTAFTSQPDEFSVIIAIAAGIAGTLSLTEGRYGALVGVIVSVTTIPAAASVGVGISLQDLSEVRGGLAQLGINIACLLGAGILTLRAQDLLWRRTRVRRSRQIESASGGRLNP